MVRSEYGDIVVLAYRAVEVGKKRLEQPVELQQVVVRQPGLGAIGMIDVVVARQADRENVGNLVLPQRFAGDRGAREIEGQGVSEGARQQRAVERRTWFILSFAEDLRKLAAFVVPGAIVRHGARIGRFREQRRPARLEKAVGGLGLVEGRHPGWMRLHVIRARRKTPAVAHVHVGRAGLARGQDRAAVLAGDCDDFGARIAASQHVADRFDQKVFRAGARQFRSSVVDVGVGVVAGAIHRRRCDGVPPLVADDAGAVRIRAGEHGGVPGPGDGERMPVVRIGEPCAAVQESRESVGGELVAIVHDLPLRQAIHDEKDHELRFARGSAIGGGAASEQGGGKEEGTKNARRALEERWFHLRSLSGNYYSRNSPFTASGLACRRHRKRIDAAHFRARDDCGIRQPRFEKIDRVVPPESLPVHNERRYAEHA